MAYFTPPQPKEIISAAIDKDIKVWLKNEIPPRRRSYFINAVLRRAMKRANAKKQAEGQQS